MNCDSCDDPKNSRTAAAAGFALIRSCGMTVSISTLLMRSRIARSILSVSKDCAVGHWADFAVRSHQGHGRALHSSPKADNAQLRAFL